MAYQPILNIDFENKTKMQLSRKKIWRKDKRISITHNKIQWSGGALKAIPLGIHEAIGTVSYLGEEGDTAKSLF